MGKSCMSNELRNVIERAQGKKKEMTEWTKEERDSIPPKYGCQILIENATLEQVKDPSWPTDAYLVFYTINDKNYMDLCRGGKKVSIFDLYYDKFGSGSIKKIEWGYGRVNPRTWGYKAPEKKKRK